MNFALILFVVCVVTGILWSVDRWWARKRRPEGAKDPLWVEWGGSFFPVILVVFLLRSFLVEPFKIPSGSMLPTLFIGDFILVNKFTYGIRLPVLNKKVIELNAPRRGDVIVFRYPPDPSLDYIKRVVGLPGDRVEYRDKRLTVNGQAIALKKIDDWLDKDRMYYTPRFLEALAGVDHDVLIEPDAPSYVSHPGRFPYRENCHYNTEGMSCQVPPGHYFVMGDNRDNSMDSRFWGFVPDGNLVGKAFFIWFNFGDPGRIGGFR